MGKVGLKLSAFLVGVSMLAIPINFAYAGEYSSDEKAQARRIVKSYGDVIKDSENRKKRQLIYRMPNFLQMQK